ncbi:tRNA threonylcarbamoyladenosine dehydratase [Pelomonas aquatica]|jgi:tRNA A37 threonylcarbamoyladenosine dehydratase|uniref:tRNA threonylcarbamoyladenosine dehydratase n=1 Tax=Pelomonas aquatica TaxID=431058 RepID=A0A9X4LH39_9BURK|nr:tRNA threonylcarbamoyladenosine dehydratase [Pelomonas aquatica]MCY4756136.1 tRNA threonylcarbamoyladenosine dehydratase [Pelomonas aquatica]MDG0863420.1 tRNA threonylcarbamoyladenosine dehydratase [Pelomonas aquatica]
MAADQLDADLERRFGGLRRLHGDAAYQRLRAARFAVVGLGGVGSWAVEALARCGAAELLLIDLDQVSESNINRQIQALGSTVGMAKAEALRLRIADIHPGCTVRVVEEFVEPDNWPALIGGAELDGLIDCCDQVRAKATLAAWARERRLPFVTVGAAGGKREPQRVQIDDLSATTHDPLLASLRQRLRKHHGAPRGGHMDVACVYSREPVHLPQQGAGEACAVDGSLNCHGYGSSVAVTATFGLCAAAELQRLHLARQPG